MIKTYGTPPCAVVAVHGGPGARGSLGGFARELSLRSELCVAEPWQSEHSVSALVRELAEQIESLSPPCPPDLIGHSWGAWLCLLLAAEYPHLAGKLILVGAPPLESSFVPQIAKRRRANLGKEDRARFSALASRMEGKGKPLSDTELAELGALAEQADGVDLLPKEEEETLPDAEANALVWREAAALRESGELKRRISRVRNPVFVFQGDRDPHPFEGVAFPLSEMKLPLRSYVISACGHEPYRERRAADVFYGFLCDILHGEI